MRARDVRKFPDYERQISRSVLAEDQFLALGKFGRRAARPGISITIDQTAAFNLAKTIGADPRLSKKM